LRDDVGRSVHAPQPATRVVTLAPFLTDYVVAAGAADVLAGIADGSEPPPVMRRIARVGDVPSFMVQDLHLLKPDLVLAFKDDIRPDEVDKIASSGVTVFVANGHSLADVAPLLRAVGSLTGRDVSAAAERFSARLESLAATYARRPPLRVFAELSNRPLATAGERHYLSRALRICGADNVFQDAAADTLQVAWEDVAARNPAAVIGIGSASSDAEFRANWSLRSNIPAVRLDRLQFVEWGPSSHPTPRSAELIAKLCVAIDRVRSAILGLPPAEDAKPGGSLSGGG
jgi:ABC-type Fe3+-hydroxamate transport system substrate-binding protein